VRHMGTESTPRGGTSPAQSPSQLRAAVFRPSTLTDTRPPCFEVEKHALRLGASAHYLPTNLGPSPLRTGSL
jgi:hypothetical protein